MLFFPNQKSIANSLIRRDHSAFHRKNQCQHEPPQLKTTSAQPYEKIPEFETS